MMLADLSGAIGDGDSRRYEDRTVSDGGIY